MDGVQLAVKSDIVFDYIILEIKMPMGLLIEHDFLKGSAKTTDPVNLLEFLLDLAKKEVSK